MAAAGEDLGAYIRDVPDFPAPGVLFKDITPLLADGPAWRRAVGAMSELVAGLGAVKVAGIESRGFVLAAPVAERLGLGFVPIRKPGKLPWKTTSVRYDLEYGSDGLEVHVDATAPGERIAVVDDVLATGGTAAAAVELLTTAGAEVAGLVFLLELTFLDGRSRLGRYDAHAVIAC